MGEKERERQAEEDLELSEQDAEGVKGGFIPIGDGGKSDARQITKATHKKGKHQKKK